ncbi:toxin-antitoxin system, toxin component [Streptomyces sp. YIM 121038]|uniref:toxin-antitoxin system, toxin component n=1 Tax=Streptomyces sp. YIM 121038 TaxID=2136401 RepID=UPI001110C3E8|nr:toxin-antitoxin system, toxin component [Streptomyces sp. YIM 121038]
MADLFQHWCLLLSQDRARTVACELVPFPASSPISGALFRCRDRDLIVVEADTPPFHQIAIFGHETYHLYCGGCEEVLPEGRTAAARLLSGSASQQDVVEALEWAARSGGGKSIEHDADRFGVLLSARCRRRLAPGHSKAALPLARRIMATLSREEHAQSH